MISDPLTQIAFSIYENRGVYALLVGSGLSRAAAIPTAWEITEDLIRRVAISQGESEQIDWVSWYRERSGKDPDYSELVEELGDSPEERRSILESYIEPSDEERAENLKIPTPAHQAIAELVAQRYIRVIVTTNFDRLIENALNQRGVEPTVVASVDALKGAVPLTHASCYLLKLHGDYKDSRILNTDGELAEYPSEYNALLDRIFDEHGIVVCGWSGEWDDALHAAVLRCPARRYTTYWAARGKPGDRAQALIAARSARVVPITDADTLFSSLGDRIETLAQSHFQHPQSLELLVNSVKRLLSKPEYKIQLDELVTSEAQALNERLEDATLDPHSEFNPEAFRKRVGIYEAATEPLARMFGVLGRWGAGGELTNVLDLIRAFWSRAKGVRGGNVVWLDLGSYPAVLLVAAYGIGLVRAERWETLHRVFLAEIEHRDGTALGRVVDFLFLQGWSGGKKEIWQTLGGFERRKTPLSDHLLETFTPWSESFAAIVPDFDELYETWEILGSLVYGEINSLKVIRETHEGKHPGQAVAWSPIGRSAWKDHIRERILNRIQGKLLREQLLASGFAKGDAELFSALIDNFRGIAERMRWL